MDIEQAVRFAQVYRFMTDVFRYPEENWLRDLGLLSTIINEIQLPPPLIDVSGWDLISLQAEHRRVFGLTGSLCYETEYGLPHEFRQSQELADISGFYQAFGFKLGGILRERPDHIIVELEFLYVLCLKEALAQIEQNTHNAEISREAQCAFITDHIGRWAPLFSMAVEKTSYQAPDYKAPAVQTPIRLEVSPYTELARFTANFVAAHANRVGAEPVVLSAAEIRPTPLGAEMSCGDCTAQGAGL
jgi:putative dimethyl sulfoxide reductase chaperone